MVVRLGLFGISEGLSDGWLGWIDGELINTGPSVPGEQVGIDGKLEGVVVGIKNCCPQCGQITESVFIVFLLLLRGGLLFV